MNKQCNADSIFYFYYIEFIHFLFLKFVFISVWSKIFPEEAIEQIFFSEFSHLVAQTYVIFRSIRRACRALLGKLRRVWPDPFVAVFTLECSLSLANWALDAATFTRCARLCSHVVEHTSCVAGCSFCSPPSLLFSFPPLSFSLPSVSCLTAFTANAIRKR